MPTVGSTATVHPAPRQDKPWGNEIIFAAQDDRYVGKIIHVNAGNSLSLQYHTFKDETISVISGTAVTQFGPSADELTEQVLHSGDTIHLPPGAVHRVTPFTDLVFVEAFTADPGWREGVTRIQDDYGREGTNQP